MLDTKNFAKELAEELIGAQKRAEREDIANAIAFQPTNVKPKKINLPVKDVFNGAELDFDIDVYTWDLPNPAVPAKKENYVFREDLLKSLIYHLKIDTDYGLFLTGKKGTGKSSLVEQTCATLGLPLYREVGSATTEYIDLFGMILPTVSGKVKFFPGGLYNALKHGGIFLLDEVDMMQPSELTKLNEIFNAKRLFVPQTEEWIEMHEDFRFCVTGNSNGNGTTDGYVGVNVLNEAFMDRFYIIDVEYMDREHEIEALRQFCRSQFEKIKVVDPDLYLDSCDLMVDCATQIRKSAEDTGIPVLSFRGLERWCKGFILDGDLISAFNQAYANGLDAGSKEGVMEIVKMQFQSV